MDAIGAAATIDLLSLRISGSRRGRNMSVTMEQPKGLTSDLYYPGNAAKLPVVFLAHNGGGKKEDWADYPRKVAEGGYFVASLGWTDFAGSADFAEAIDAILGLHADRVDSGRVAFVGGCHGGMKMISLMKEGSSGYFLRAAVFLSVAEETSLPDKHVPVLAFYATEDRLGSYYQGISRRIAEQAFDEPKKVVVVNGTPHGHELVTDAISKGPVRDEIGAWLEGYLKAE